MGVAADLTELVLHLLLPLPVLLGPWQVVGGSASLGYVGLVCHLLLLGERFVSFEGHFLAAREEDILVVVHEDVLIELFFLLVLR